MQRSLASVLIAACALLTSVIAPFHAHAQSEASALSAVSAMPLASVVGATSAVAGAVVAVPVALSVGGAVLVESVFVIPGLGSMLVTAVLQKDYPTVQSVALVLTVVFVMISLVVDIGCAMLDPRTRR